jgi:5'-methylthioadenosine phosphorylase
MLAIIGGSGLTQLSNLEGAHRKAVRTPYGEPSGAITFGTLRGNRVMFLARHGYGHTIPPHEVNYRANIWALHEEGASGIVSVASVGGIRDDLGPGVLVVPHQLIDYTWGRRSTFFEGGDVPVTHVDFTEPYSRRLRTSLFDAARACGEEVHDGAVYACTQGPRLESAAEVERLARDGADIVGMTGMPEAALARELDFEYATIAVVVNHAAGRGESTEGIKFEKLEAVLQQSMGRVRRIIEEMAQRA